MRSVGSSVLHTDRINSQLEAVRAAIVQSKEVHGMNVLFVCSKNHCRSPTAETLFNGTAGIVARSAGTNDDAAHPVEPDDIEWADLVLAMEQRHANKLRLLFGDLVAGKVRVLRIRDEYDPDDPVLIDLLRRKVTPLLLSGLSSN